MGLHKSRVYWLLLDTYLGDVDMMCYAGYTLVTAFAVQTSCRAGHKTVSRLCGSGLNGSSIPAIGGAEYSEVTCSYRPRCALAADAHFNEFVVLILAVYSLFDDTPFVAQSSIQTLTVYTI